VADTHSTHHSSPNARRFSAGLVTGIVTLAWLVVFGAVMVHGLDGIHQHDEVVATQAK